MRGIGERRRSPRMMLENTMMRIALLSCLASFLSSNYGMLAIYLLIPNTPQSSMEYKR